MASVNHSQRPGVAGQHVLLSCSRHNPLRPVDWRWKRAQYVFTKKLEDKVLLEGEDDSFCTCASDLIKKLNSLNGYDDSDILKGHRYSYIAYEIYQDGKSSLRHEMEARLLARENFPAIARRFGLQEEVVHYYHGIFFDIKDRLDYPSYIMHCLTYDTSKTHSPEYALWKLCGYWGGTETLDAILYRNPAELFKNVNDDDYDNRVIMCIRKRLAESLSTVTAGDTETLTQLISAFQDLQRSVQQVDLHKRDGRILDDLMEMLRNIPWRTGRRLRMLDDDDSVPLLASQSKVTWDEIVKENNSED